MSTGAPDFSKVIVVNDGSNILKSATITSSNAPAEGFYENMFDEDNSTELIWQQASLNLLFDVSRLRSFSSVTAAVNINVSGAGASSGTVNLEGRNSAGAYIVLATASWVGLVSGGGTLDFALNGGASISDQIRLTFNSGLAGTRNRIVQVSGFSVEGDD